MLLKFLVEEDFVNYKKPSMFLGFPNCTFKCDLENGNQFCQNFPLVKQPNLDIPVEKIYMRYLSNDITKAIVCGGLEPFESFDDLYNLIQYFRENCCDDKFVIYTGFTEEEIKEKFPSIFDFTNLVIKYGRFRPDKKSHLDEILGIELASDNQYAKSY